MSDFTKLLNIQKKIVCGKGQYNSFGKYKFRSCEDILKAFNELDSGCAVILSDEIILIGDRYYVKAMAKLIDCNTGEVIATNTGLAREALYKKGMDEAQITGAASSYARKYALCGLFALDGEDDADKLNTSKEYTEIKEVVVSPIDISMIQECINNVSLQEVHYNLTAQQMKDHGDKNKWTFTYKDNAGQNKTYKVSSKNLQKQVGNWLKYGLK